MLPDWHTFQLIHPAAEYHASHRRSLAALCMSDMEDRVQSMLKIIEEDADSFAKRAEMYYKRRPELINFVEETYRAYRALAERYDRILGELLKANHTLATAFPDVEFPMQDEDEDGFPKALSSTDSADRSPPDIPQISLHKPPPEVPKVSLMSKKNGNKPAPQKSLPRAAPKKSKPRNFTSQISEDKAKEEIDRLQKGILILQTEKEFIKSSYESGIAKSWAIEKKITEMQKEVCFLEDEFSASSVIEDDEARALMAVTALKSYKVTMVNLQEQQKRSTEDTKIESERIQDAKEKLKALKSECGQAEEEMEDVPDETTGTGPPTRTPENESCDLEQESLDIQSICEKVKEHFETNTSGVDLAEKIDELVKVVNLDLIVASQGAQIEHLRSEIDELQKHLRSLEEEKGSVIDDSNSLSDRLKQAEELHRVQNLEKSLNSEKIMLRRVFAEACHSLSEISEKLQSPKHPVQDKTDHVHTVEQLQFSKLLDQVNTAGPFPSREEDRSLRDTTLEKASEVNRAMTMKDTKDKAEGEDHENQIQLESNPLIAEGLRKSEPEDEIRENHHKKMTIIM